MVDRVMDGWMDESLIVEGSLFCRQEGNGRDHDGMMIMMFVVIISMMILCVWCGSSSYY